MPHYTEELLKEKVILEKSQFLRNIHFLCDAVDLN